MKNNVLIGVLLFATLCGAPKKSARKDAVKAEERVAGSTDDSMPEMMRVAKKKLSLLKVSFLVVRSRTLVV